MCSYGRLDSVKNVLPEGLVKTMPIRLSTTLPHFELPSFVSLPFILS